MRRHYVEVDDNGVVVEIHHVETKGNKGNAASEPRVPITKRKPTHTVHLSTAANKGDKWSETKQCFLRPLTKR
jgi:hypothetical protein